MEVDFCRYLLSNDEHERKNAYKIICSRLAGDSNESVHSIDVLLEELFIDTSKWDILMSKLLEDCRQEDTLGLCALQFLAFIFSFVWVQSSSILQQVHTRCITNNIVYSNIIQYIIQNLLCKISTSNINNDYSSNKISSTSHLIARLFIIQQQNLNPILIKPYAVPLFNQLANILDIIIIQNNNNATENLKIIQLVLSCLISFCQKCVITEFPASFIPAFLGSLTYSMNNNNNNNQDILFLYLQVFSLVPVSLLKGVQDITNTLSPLFSHLPQMLHALIITSKQMTSNNNSNTKGIFQQYQVNCIAIFWRMYVDIIDYSLFISILTTPTPNKQESSIMLPVSLMLDISAIEYVLCLQCIARKLIHQHNKQHYQSATSEGINIWQDKYPLRILKVLLRGLLYCLTTTSTNKINDGSTHNKATEDIDNSNSNRVCCVIWETFIELATSASSCVSPIQTLLHMEQLETVLKTYYQTVIVAASASETLTTLSSRVAQIVCLYTRIYLALMSHTSEVCISYDIKRSSDDDEENIGINTYISTCGPIEDSKSMLGHLIEYATILHDLLPVISLLPITYITEKKSLISNINNAWCNLVKISVLRVKYEQNIILVNTNRNNSIQGTPQQLGASQLSQEAVQLPEHMATFIHKILTMLIVYISNIWNNVESDQINHDDNQPQENGIYFDTIGVAKEAPVPVPEVIQYIWWMTSQLQAYHQRVHASIIHMLTDCLRKCENIHPSILFILDTIVDELHVNSSVDNNSSDDIGGRGGVLLQDICILATLFYLNITTTSSHLVSSTTNISELIKSMSLYISEIITNQQLRTVLLWLPGGLERCLNTSKLSLNGNNNNDVDSSSILHTSSSSSINQTNNKNSTSHQHLRHVNIVLLSQNETNNYNVICTHINTIIFQYLSLYYVQIIQLISTYDCPERLSQYHSQHSTQTILHMVTTIKSLVCLPLTAIFFNNNYNNHNSDSSYIYGNNLTFLHYLLFNNETTAATTQAWLSLLKVWIRYDQQESILNYLHSYLTSNSHLYIYISQFAANNYAFDNNINENSKLCQLSCIWIEETIDMLVCMDQQHHNITKEIKYCFVDIFTLMFMKIFIQCICSLMYSITSQNLHNIIHNLSDSKLISILYKRVTSLKSLRLLKIRFTTTFSDTTNNNNINNNCELHNVLLLNSTIEENAYIVCLQVLILLFQTLYCTTTTSLLMDNNNYSNNRVILDQLFYSFLIQISQEYKISKPHDKLSISKYLAQFTKQIHPILSSNAPCILYVLNFWQDHQISTEHIPQEIVVKLTTSKNSTNNANFVAASSLLTPSNKLIRNEAVVMAAETKSKVHVIADSAHMSGVNISTTHISRKRSLYQAEALTQQSQSQQLDNHGSCSLLQQQSRNHISSRYTTSAVNIAPNQNENCLIIASTGPLPVADTTAHIGRTSAEKLNSNTMGNEVVADSVRNDELLIPVISNRRLHSTSRGVIIAKLDDLLVTVTNVRELVLSADETKMDKASMSALLVLIDSQRDLASRQRSILDDINDH